MVNLPLTQSERRTLGRFDTPRPLAQAVTDWAVRDKTNRVLEPSVGGGVIVQSIATRLKELGAEHGDRQIVACDIDPRALVETAHCMRGFSPHLVRGNFLALNKDDLGGHLFDAVVANPPYIRRQTMDLPDREIARLSLPEGVFLDAKASLWAYFPIHAFKFLKSGGRMAWILPETILHSDYGRQILQWATKNFGRCVAVSLRERCFIGNGAKERVVILLLEAAGKTAIRGIEMVEFESAIDCITALTQMCRKESAELPQLNGHAVPHLVSLDAAEASTVLDSCEIFVPLSEIANIRIGVVTGNNKFFVMSERQRIAANLRAHHFQPVVSKFVDLGTGFEFMGSTGAPTPDNSEIRSNLLCPKPINFDKSLANYLLSYPQENIDTNRTMQKRSHWQCPTLGETPDAFLRYMGKCGPRMVINQGSSYCTNTIHSVTFKSTITKANQRAVCLAMHSTYSQLSAEFEGRQYGSGVLKLEPSEAKRLRVPASPEILDALAKQWTNLAKKAHRLGWEKVVGEIDQIIVSNSKELSKTLPPEHATRILEKVRNRRNGLVSVGVGGL
jgi:adenine-specific DNA-methyltransferase